MPFTTDDKLELAFPANLISQEVKAALPADLHMRPLASDDHARGHLAVLAVLTQAPDHGAAAWRAQYDAYKATPETYFPLVIVSKETDRIVGAGTVFLERKFLRGLGRVGHIEDIAVAKDQQGKKLGLRIINALTSIAENAGCYKTILNCSTANIPFYQKCGYVQKENEMAKYAPERPTTPAML